MQQNLPKTAQKQLAWRILKYHQKSMFDVFQETKSLCVEEATMHMFTI
jgi:hypothetical protein